MSFAEVVLIPTGTAAVVTPSEYDAEDLSALVVTAFGLAGAEKMAVVVIDRVTGDSAAVYDGAGAAVELTPTNPQVALEGGPLYGFTRTATAGDSRLVGHPRR